jgi:outer membrane lipoprotein-sorting protein
VVNESAAASAGGYSRRRWARWLVPVAVTGALVGGPAAAALLPAGAAASLPPLTAAQLLEKIQTAKVAGFSGDVTASTDLGLPKLPAGLAGGASALSLLTGDHSVRVWQSGQDQSRVALLDTFAETEVVRSGSDVWTYDSTKNAVTHVRLPDRAAPNAKSAPADGSPAEGSPFGGAEALTPADAAAKVLAAIDPTTQVTVGEAATVAGRSAYELRVSPRSTSSLVDTVVLAVDADNWLPLRVAVTARGQHDPAVDVRFTQVSLDVPAAARFQFAPPKGATVQERSLPARSDAAGMKPDAQSPEAKPANAPETVGTGWDSVLVARGVDTTAIGGSSAPESANAQGLADMITRAAKPVTGAFGSGRLVQTSLATVLLTSDGRLYAGAVTPEALLAVAAAHP